MAYRDKDKQRRAVREATRRYRARKQGITKPECDVIPRDTPLVIPVVVVPGTYTNRQATEALAYAGLGKPKPQSHSPMMVGYVPPLEGKVC